MIFIEHIIISLDLSSTKHNNCVFYSLRSRIRPNSQNLRSNWLYKFINHFHLTSSQQVGK